MVLRPAAGCLAKAQAILSGISKVGQVNVTLISIHRYYLAGLHYVLTIHSWWVNMRSQSREAALRAYAMRVSLD